MAFSHTQTHWLEYPRISVCFQLELPSLPFQSLGSAKYTQFIIFVIQKSYFHSYFVTETWITSNEFNSLLLEVKLNVSTYLVLQSDNSHSRHLMKRKQPMNTWCRYEIQAKYKEYNLQRSVSLSCAGITKHINKIPTATIFIVRTCRKSFKKTNKTDTLSNRNWIQRKCSEQLLRYIFFFQQVTWSQETKNHVSVTRQITSFSGFHGYLRRSDSVIFMQPIKEHWEN